MTLRTTIAYSLGLRGLRGDVEEPLEAGQRNQLYGQHPSGEDDLRVELEKFSEGTPVEIAMGRGFLVSNLPGNRVFRVRGSTSGETRPFLTGRGNPVIQINKGNDTGREFPTTRRELEPPVFYWQTFALLLSHELSSLSPFFKTKHMQVLPQWDPRRGKGRTDETRYEVTKTP